MEPESITIARGRILSYHGCAGALATWRPAESSRRTCMASAEPGGLKGLVDIECGIISREIFVNEEIYRQELERIFTRAWLFVGHESQISKPGDYLTSCMGEESVIVCRDRTGGSASSSIRVGTAA